METCLHGSLRFQKVRLEWRGFSGHGFGFLGGTRGFLRITDKNGLELGSPSSPKLGTLLIKPFSFSTNYCVMFVYVYGGMWPKPTWFGNSSGYTGRI